MNLKTKQYFVCFTLKWNYVKVYKVIEKMFLLKKNFFQFRYT